MSPPVLQSETTAVVDTHHPPLLRYLSFLEARRPLCVFVYQ